MSPELLPSIPVLRRVAQSLAMLDAILCPEWEYRYYSFNAAWGPGREMASMRNGSGDDWFLLFPSEVPPEFSSFLNEPAFSLANATFCYWRRAAEATWSRVAGLAPDDGSDEMLKLLVSGPSTYQQWAQEYFEVPVALEGVMAVFNHSPLSDTLIRSLNPEADIAGVHADASEIGYPNGAT